MKKTTEVNKIMAGKFIYGEEYNNLNDLLGEENTEIPLFGIVKNGQMIFSKNIDRQKTMNPMNLSNKEGRLYAFFPTADGILRPTAINIKHFNEEEFNLNDPEIQKTPIYQDIIEALNKFVSVSDQEDVIIALKEGLNQILYTRNLAINYFNKDGKEGLVFTNIARDENGQIKKEIIDGKEVRTGESFTVYFSEFQESVKLGTFGEGSEDAWVPASPTLPTSISNEEKLQQIIKGLQKFNLPFQISTKKFNNPALMGRFIKSGILFTNLVQVQSVGNWFTTNPFTKEGNEVQGIAPASHRPTFTLGESVISGVPIQIGTVTYYHQEDGTVLLSNGQTFNDTKHKQLISDLAWAERQYGSKRFGTNMISNKVILPDGNALDRTTQSYLNEKETLTLKQQIAGNTQGRAIAEKVLEQIEKNQALVDKESTTSTTYKIKEEDGKYYDYGRISNEIGSNSKPSDARLNFLKQIKANLIQASANPTHFSNLLDYYNKEYDLDLSNYKGKTDPNTLDQIYKIVEQASSEKFGSNSLAAGTSVDNIVRDFFKGVEIVKPDNISQKAFEQLFNRLRQIKDRIDETGETFLTNNIVLFKKIPQW